MHWGLPSTPALLCGVKALPRRAHVTRRGEDSPVRPPVGKGAGAQRRAFVLLASLTACVLFRPPLQSPEEGGDLWNQLTTAHFVLYTDLSIAQAQSRIAQFETLRSALEDVSFPPSGQPERRAAVVLFRHSSDYEALAPNGTDAVFYDRLPLDLEREPTLLVSGGFMAGTPPRDVMPPLLSRCPSTSSMSPSCWSSRGSIGQTPLDPQRRFVHEMVHDLMHRAFGDTPLWLNEGLAQYFSTIRIEGDQIVLGDPVPQDTAVPASVLPTVSEITHGDRSQFWPRDFDTATSARYYAGAWVLVHMLRNGPQRYRERFNVLAGALNEGKTADLAWRLAMAGLDEETLQGDFVAYAKTSVWRLVEKRATAHAWPPAATRSMRPAEVHLLWARIAPPDAAGRAFAGEQINKVDRLEPDWADVAYARGCLATALEHPSEASAAFRKAVTLSPDDPRYLFGLARSLSTEPLAANNGDSPELSRTYDRLAATATSPEQVALVASFLVATAHPEDALQRAEQAVRADRRCAPCAGALAKILAARGDMAGAIAVIERALSASLESPQDRDLLEALERYGHGSKGEDK
jgi:tetratricopeptide (TPR) repeat protein